MANTIQDFVNPKATLTLGGMSAIVITVATIINKDFHIDVAYVALGLSMLLAALQVSSATDVKGAFRKIAYTFLTGLIIFASARGGSTTLSRIEEARAPAAMGGPEPIAYSMELPPPAVDYDMVAEEPFEPIGGSAPMAPMDTEIEHEVSMAVQAQMPVFKAW